MTDKPKVSKYKFKAEVKQLLDILVHSLYTNKEIFLRELVSNASDALDKLRFESNRGAELADSGLPLEIRIDFDKDNKLIRISDTGIGMTREEVVSNIGTIARSGSAEFFKKAAEEKGGLENIIGQFGVGFYSVFMVAKEVVLTTKSYLKDEPPVEWRSDGLGSYQITESAESISRGTTIEVHLRDEAVEYADKERLKGIIERHSNFISFPIHVEDDRVNTVEAIWREPKFNIKEEQYNEFYKFLTFDSEAPLVTIHTSVDAPVQYNSLLFIPQKSFDFPGMTREAPGLDLYVRRVLIQRGNNEILPEYLGFVRGVVDSEDIPLNISRETLQENLILGKIAANMTKQVLTHLQKTADDDREKYEAFWKEHGRLFKIGYGDFANREKYASLLRFNSSRCEDSNGLISFDEYIEKAQLDQKEIYYVFGHSREAVALNPHMEIFKSKGLEVLFLYDPLDEFAMESVRTYKEFEIKSVEHVDPSNLDKYESREEEEKADPLDADDEKEFDKFLERIRDILGDRITEVKVSARLSGSPCCLINPDGGLTSTMQKILQIAGKDDSIPQKILEVNKDHKLIRNLFSIYKANPQDDYLSTAVEQLFESSLLLEGYLKDPHALVGRIQGILDRSSGWYLEITKNK